MKEIWIVEGVVTDPDVGPLGQTEWQFSDGPPGERGSSSDYLSLEEGLRHHEGCSFHFVPQPKTFKATVEFEIPYEEFQNLWMYANQVQDPVRSVRDMIQRDLYDYCGMEGGFEVLSVEATE